MQAPFSTILCAVDLDDNSLRALGVAAKVVRETGARLIILHVVNTESAPLPKRQLDPFLIQEREARKFLEDLGRERLRDIAFEVITRSGHPDVAILHVAEEIQADLLVMATHTRNQPPHQFAGSTAEKVLRQAGCPVLMVPVAKGGNIDLVASWMTAQPVTTSPASTLAQVTEKMREGGFRCMPVVEAGRLVGLITERDVRNCLGELDNVEVRHIMTAEVITVTPATSVQEAARLLLECKIGGLPVTEDGCLVGIITVEDVIKFMLGRQ